MDIPILYEDDSLLVISKPTGLVVHGDGRTKELSVAGWFIQHYPKSKEVGEPITRSSGEAIERPGIVHRIDRETSGVLLLAKTAGAHAHLKKQFQERAIEKKYNAFVWGRFSDAKKEGRVDFPIGKSRKDFRRYSALKNPRGTVRDALTHYSVLSQTAEHAFLEARPKTGRTHQVRVHLHAIQHPIVCDALYAPQKKPALGFTRLALHARSLSFRDLAGKARVVESPFPDDFKKALEVFPGAEAIASS